jgi:hypothetical protein
MILRPEGDNIPFLYLDEGFLFRSSPSEPPGQPLSPDRLLFPRSGGWGFRDPQVSGTHHTLRTLRRLAKKRKN